MLAGAAAMTGGVISLTTTLKAEVTVLPQTSVPVYVLVRVNAPGHAPATVTSAKVVVTALQPSAKTGGVNAGAAGQEIGEVPPAGVVTVGGVTSTVLFCV